MIGCGIGLTRGGRALWTPKKLGAAWVLDNQGFTLSGSNITGAASRFASTTMSAAAGREPVRVVGDAATYTLNSSTSPFTGVAALRTSNAATKLWSLTGGPTGATPWTRVSIVQRMGAVPASGSATHSLFGEPGAAGPYNVGLGWTTAAISTFGNGSGAGLQLPQGNPYTDLLPHHVIEVYNGTTLTSYLDGRALGGPLAKTYAIPTGAFGYAPWYYLAGNASYNVMDTIVHAQTVVVGRNATAAELALLTRWDLANLTGATGGPRAVVCFGDSTTAGTASGAEPLAVALRATETAPNLTLADNEGVSGERSDQIRTRATAYTGIATHMVIWAGVNHTLSPVTPSADAAAAYSDILAMVTYCRGRKIIPVVGTLPQWGSSTPGSYTDDYRLALNVLILAGAASGLFTAADIATAFGAYNSSNFCVDTLHENIASLRALVAPTIHAALIASV